MSEDRSSNGQKSWLGKLTQAFAHEPKNRQELLELLREAHQNKLLDSEALAIVEGAIQVADLQVRDIMVPRSQMISIKATQTPREFLPAVIDSAHSRYPVIGESLDDVIGILLAKDLLRVFAGGLVLGQFLSPGFFMSLSGALVSLSVLALAERLPRRWFGPVSWSILAAFAHIGGQLALARLWLIPHNGLFYLVPLFAAAALAFGIINGLIAARLLAELPATEPEVSNV